MSAPEPIDMAALMAQARAGGAMRLEAQGKIIIRTEPLTPNAPSRGLFEHTPWKPASARDGDLNMDSGPISMRMTTPPTIAFAPALHWDVLPDGGIAVANGPEYAVDIVSPTGARLRVITRAIAPRPVTKQDEEEARQNLANGLAEARAQIGGAGSAESSSMVEQILQRQAESLLFAPTVPVLQDLRTDAQGRLWLLRSPREAHSKAGPIDIVLADGRYVGTVAGDMLPAAYSRSGRLAYIERDNLGIERVVVRQIPTPWR
jgi:hypothetical protein